MGGSSAVCDRRRQSQHPRGERASCVGRGNEEGRSGRAGALRTGEERRQEEPPHPLLDRLTDGLGNGVSSDIHRGQEVLLYRGCLMPRGGGILSMITVVLLYKKKQLVRFFSERNPSYVF